MTRTPLASSRFGRVAAATLVVLALGAGTADARPGGGGSFGSRGGRTWSAPPSTSTAPRTAAPIERSITQPASPGFNQGIGQQATSARPGGWRPGFGTGLVGGLLGAGLIGMMFGNGFMGGLGSLASLFGLILQVGLIVLVVRWALKFFRGRQPAYAGAGPSPRSALDPGAGGGLGGGGGLGSVLGGLGGLGSRLSPGAAPGAAPRQPVDAVGIGPADYQAFEHSLTAINAAWDREDMAAIRQIATPEMVSYFSEELSRNAARGLHDRVRDVKLLSGDLAESWREGPVDYATVALRFSMVNALLDKASGKVVEGDADKPQQVTEVWTFRRDDRGPWTLSAIQQA